MSARPNIHGNQGIEPMHRYHMQYIPNAKSQKRKSIKSDLTIKDGDLTLAAVSRLVMQGELALRRNGIGEVKIEKIEVHKDAIFFSIRYFPPLDGVEAADEVQFGFAKDGRRYSDYVLTVQPTVFVHWRKWHDSELQR